MNESKFAKSGLLFLEKPAKETKIAEIIPNNMFDLKVIHSVLEQLQEERGIPKEKIIEAI